MATMTVVGDKLVVNIEGLDKLWALKGSLTFPLSHVRGATHDPGLGWGVRGFKLSGARVPGVITAGRFRQNGEPVFWDVRDPSQAVVVRLTDERYAQLVIQVDDPRGTVEQIQAAVTDEAP